jgi:hypothetical protein
MLDRAAQPDSPATDEKEVTPEMVQAGIEAYYEEAFDGWANPGRNELVK